MSRFLFALSIGLLAATAVLVMLSACAPTVQPTVSGNGAAHAVTLTADRYSASDGTILPVAVWPAAAKSEGGAPVLVRDVARVELAPDERRGVTELNGEGEVVSGIAVQRYLIQG